MAPLPGNARGWWMRNRKKLTCCGLIDTLTYATGIGIIEYYVLYSIRTAHILHIKCFVTSCVTMHVKDFIRGQRKRGSTLWHYQTTRLTHYASVTPHTGLELNLATRTLSRLRRLFIVNLLQHKSTTQRRTVKYLCIKLLKCSMCSERTYCL